MVNLYTLFGEGAKIIIVPLTSEENNEEIAMILNSNIIKDEKTGSIEAESFLENFPGYVRISYPIDGREKIVVYKGGNSKYTQ